MKILIVDDEIISRKILTRKMEALGECLPVDNSRRALEEFDKSVRENNPFDLITLDVSMPHMDGRQVLAEIRKKEARLHRTKKDQVKIIMVTARMNRSTIKACIKLGCNGYLSKPVTQVQILESLGKMGLEIPVDLTVSDQNTHTRVVAEIITRFYKGKIPLPVFPKVVREVQDLFTDNDPSIEALGQVIEKDIVISGKLISIANSPLYKGLGRVENLNSALIRLGLKTSRSVISSVAARNLFDSKSRPLKVQMERLWMHSFATACLAKKLGEALGMSNPEALFLMGIMHDIGKMLLFRAYVDISPDRSLEDQTLHMAIHEIHTTFGAALLKKLRFSKPFVQVAEFHHWEEYSGQMDPNLMVINLSDHLACFIGYPNMEEDRGLSLENIKDLSSLKGLGLEFDQVMKLTEEIRPIIQETGQVF